MNLNITVLPGDGIGPEVTREAVRILRAVADFQGYRFHFDERPIGGAAIREFSVPLPESTLEACVSSDAVLLGAVGLPQFDNLPRSRRPEAGLLGLRRALGGFANLRPAIAYKALSGCSPLRAEVREGADILMVRELLGGIYFGEPRGADESAAWNTMRYSVEEVERIAQVAFGLALKRRRHVTSVDKANVLETSQLWREVVTRVARQYPQVSCDHLYVDTCAMQLVTNPRRFDVLLTENMFGDILSDEAAALSGSLGVLASATVGGGVDLYEPVHGSAPDIAGKGKANPLGAIASAALLLRHSAGLDAEATAVESAIHEVLEWGYRTPDLGDGEQVNTQEMGTLVEHALADILDRRHSYHAV
ncbi:MAG: 3-isopropylmalate dehydrogenase [Terriglobales bacterium]